MLEYLVRHEYVVVLRRGSGGKPAIIELIDPEWLKHLNPVRQETKDLLLSETKEKKYGICP